MLAAAIAQPASRLADLEALSVEAEAALTAARTGLAAAEERRLELVVDLDNEEITSAQGELVPMRHDVVPVDRTMLAWVHAKEEALAPEASKVVARTKATVRVTW